MEEYDILIKSFGGQFQLFTTKYWEVRLEHYLVPLLGVHMDLHKDHYLQSKNYSMIGTILDTNVRCLIEYPQGTIFRPSEGYNDVRFCGLVLSCCVRKNDWTCTENHRLTFTYIFCRHVFSKQWCLFRSIYKLFRTKLYWCHDEWIWDYLRIWSWGWN